MPVSFGSISLPTRTVKPRDSGITMVLDSGLGLNATKDLVETAGDYIDIVKLGWGTSRLFSDELLKKKVELMKSHGIKVCPGGSFVEIAAAQNKVDEFFGNAKAIGFDCVEVSNGVHPMSEEEKIGIIKKAVAHGFSVTSEVGKKNPEEDALLSADDRVRLAEQELEAGAWKVIMESRASGKLGMFDSSGKVKEEMAKELFSRLDISKIIFEAPAKAQQLWLIERLGNDVNLGNIRPDDAIPLETLRLGLRGDTLKKYHLE
ncbi:phosphosulfolactate synthase [archaeon]